LSTAPESGPRDVSQIHLRALARGGVINLVGVIASAAFGFALVVVVTRGFNPTQVGLFFIAVALFTLAMNVAVWGADVGLVRMIPRLRVLERGGDIRPVVRIAIITVFWISLAIAAAMFVLAPHLSAILTTGVGQGSVEPLIRSSVPFLPLAAVYTILLATTRGLGRMGPTNVIDRIGRAAVQPILALLASILGLGVVALIVGWALPYAIGCAVAALWVAATIRRPTGLDTGLEQAGDPAPRALFLEFWRFALPRGLAGLFAVSVLWLDTLLVGALRSTQDAGLYAAATRYLMFGAFASQAVIQAIGPTMSELLTRHDRETARTVYRTGTAWAMAVGWPVYLMLAVFAPAVLSIFGPGYVEAQHVLTILALTMLVASAVGPVDVVLLMAGRSTWNLINTAAAVALNVALNLLLIPRVGITGAAVAWSASILTNNLAPLVQVRTLLHLDPLGRGVLSVAAASLVAFGAIPLAVRLVLGADLGPFGVSAALGLAVYIPVLWRLRRPLRLPGVSGARSFPTRSVHGADTPEGKERSDNRGSDV
jgi:O-antigen/teichoic acid export membrane protein